MLERLVCTMAETTKVLIEPLNGQNYATWKFQCKMVLIKDRLWNIVTGTEGENDRRKYLLRKDRAISHNCFICGTNASIFAWTRP